MMTRNWILGLATLPFFAAACAGGSQDEQQDEFEGVSPAGSDVQLTGKADGEDVVVTPGGRYARVGLSGDAAKDLWDVMENAGGFTATRSGGLDYLYGYYSICASNGSAAGCTIYSRDVSTGGDDYLATVHGRRFRSAASELFGALSRAKGVSPASVTSIASERFMCGKSAKDVWCGVTPAAPVASSVELTLSLENLGDLGPDYVYEGWLITDDGPVTSGRFDLSSASETMTFSIDAELAAAANLFVLTIEPAVGDDPAPSATHVVAGPIDNGAALLTAAHDAAFGTDFSQASGDYILETPSTSSVASDYGQGVWFIVPGQGAGLDLPTLPAGWVYEGWVVGNDGPVSTGTFTMVDAADSDGAGPTAGPDGAPPFPGQDFIEPAMSLVGNAVVISVEPSPDNAPGPFFLKPLVDMSAADIGQGMPQSMANVAANSLPSGTASFN